jgi:hypothetical protein
LKIYTGAVRMVTVEIKRSQGDVVIRKAVSQRDREGKRGIRDSFDSRSVLE